MLNARIYIALPVLNEFTNLPKLVTCLKLQTIQDFELVVCVNQYESWWNLHEKKAQCLDNQKSLHYLRSINDDRIKIIDKSSTGNGWPAKRGGVGWARKLTMDFINKRAKPDDLIISIDADTYYPPDYVESIFKTFSSFSKLSGLCVPYYHKLSGGETDLLILRYEIYMRNYLLNMLRIENPYAFTALGSAMVATVRAYRKIGGITPHKSGEDFYFIQKLAKIGGLGIWSDAIAYPSPRFSDRVLFGTGPALIKGRSGDWDSYPVYNSKLFDLVKETFDRFNYLIDSDETTPMDGFLKSQFKTDNLWKPLRANYKDPQNFIKACKTKVDGLRILQFLKQLNARDLEEIGVSVTKDKEMHDIGSINKAIVSEKKHESISHLSQIRDDLYKKESRLRRKIQVVGL